MNKRYIVWFSYGAASAAAWLAALKLYDNVIAVNCDTSANEHPDNARFKAEMEALTGKKVITIRSKKYETIEQVSDDTKYMAGINGARCTVELKKIPRFDFQKPDDIHIFGYPSDEAERYERFKTNNPDILTANPLIDLGLTKNDCLAIIKFNRIDLPIMYNLGYKNNNCIGCYKATSAAYWNKIRVEFPLVFDTRCKDSRKLGVRLTRYKGKRIFLDELPADYMLGREITENLSCGPQCGA